jgi:hypothetical protein
MSSELEVFFRFRTFDSSTYSLKELPTTASPDLDDDKAPASTDPTVERPKLKLHSCAQCELPVISRFEHPEPTLSSSLTILGEQELTYLPQHGPVCGAASVAGTILSLAAFHGLDMIQARETITVRAVQDVYNALGVPNIYTSSVAVGNLTLKKCIMAFKLEAFPSWQLTIQDFGAFLESNPEKKVLNEWEKLKKGMATGSRYIFHSRNHYNRIFGWREVWEKTRPLESKLQSSVQFSGQEDTNDDIPTEFVSSVQNIVTLVENDPYSEENVSKMIEQMQSSRKRGGEDRPLRPLSTSTSVNSYLIEPSLLRGKTTKTIEKKSITTSTGVKTVSSLTSSLLPCKETSTTQQDGAYVSQRHILMAKKGQRPQHWVPWEAVCLNTQTHKINVIFEVKMVQRKGL